MQFTSLNILQPTMKLASMHRRLLIPFDLQYDICCTLLSKKVELILSRVLWSIHWQIMKHIQDDRSSNFHTRTLQEGMLEDSSE